MICIDKNKVLDKGTAAALGVFDGLHLGHQKVLGGALAAAEELGCAPAVFTFRSGSVTSKDIAGTLTTEEDKLKMLGGMGFEYALTADFAELKDMSAEDFVKQVLKGRLNTRCVVCGEDFRFGRGGAGDVNALREICGGLGIEVRAVKKLSLGGAEVSSTRIRALIECGEIAAANELLGRRYGYTIKVEHGAQLGRTWNFPTINQPLPEGLVLPRFGVYAAKVLVDGEWLAGVTNIGVKPTVSKSAPPLAETFIIGCHEDLYGKALPIELYEFVRPERVFANFGELRDEIARNTEQVKEYFKHN